MDEKVFLTITNQGPIGLSAYQVWLAQGNSGNESAFFNSLKGATGATGAPGASAYQIWLNNGNFGTELDFLASLQANQINADWLATAGAAQILNKPILASVATSGSYTDLSGKPILGTAAALNTSAFASAAQGLLADSSVQPSDISAFETTTQLNNRDTANRNRANHTGSQAIATITGLSAALDGKQPAGSYLVAGDLSSYATLTDLSTKQNTLISGSNIKSLNGLSLLGSGNYALSKSDVGLSNVDNTSDIIKDSAVTSLTNKLQIATIKQILQPTGTTQTIDWNQGSIVELFLNLATGNVTLTLLNPVAVTTYLIKVTQGVSIRNLIFPVGSVQPNKGGNTATFLFANSDTLLSILWDGTRYYINFGGRNY